MKRFLILILLFIVSVAYGKVNIYEAVAKGDTAVVLQYLSSGKDIDAPDNINNNTPLMIAVLYDRYDVADILIKHGADMNILNKEGSTALHMAAFFCRKEIVQLLVNGGADKSIKNKAGATPIQTVQIEYNKVKPIYAHFSKTLQSIGIKVDLDYIRETRPMIAEILGD